MSKYKLPYFEELDPNSIEDYYSVEVDFEGRKIKLDLNFEGGSIGKERMTLLKPFLEHLDTLNTKALKAIKEDFEDTEDGDTVKDYIQHHLDELDEKSLSLIVDKANTAKSPEKQMLEKLQLVRIGFYPDNEDGFAILDYTIGRNITDYLVVAYVGEGGEVEYLSMES